MAHRQKSSSEMLVTNNSLMPRKMSRRPKTPTTPPGLENDINSENVMPQQFHLKQQFNEPTKILVRHEVSSSVQLSSPTAQRISNFKSLSVNTPPAVSVQSLDIVQNSVLNLDNENSPFESPVHRRLLKLSGVEEFPLGTSPDRIKTRYFAQENDFLYQISSQPDHQQQAVKPDQSSNMFDRNYGSLESSKSGTRSQFLVSANSSGHRPGIISPRRHNVNCFSSLIGPSSSYGNSLILTSPKLNSNYNPHSRGLLSPLRYSAGNTTPNHSNSPVLRNSSDSKPKLGGFRLFKPNSIGSRPPTSPSRPIDIGTKRPIVPKTKFTGLFLFGAEAPRKLDLDFNPADKTWTSNGEACVGVSKSGMEVVILRNLDKKPMCYKFKPQLQTDSETVTTALISKTHLYYLTSSLALYAIKHQDYDLTFEKEPIRLPFENTIQISLDHDGSCLFITSKLHNVYVHPGVPTYLIGLLPPSTRNAIAAPSRRLVLSMRGKKIRVVKSFFDNVVCAGVVEDVKGRVFSWHEGGEWKRIEELKGIKNVVFPSQALRNKSNSVLASDILVLDTTGILHTSAEGLHPVGSRANLISSTLIFKENGLFKADQSFEEMTEILKIGEGVLKFACAFGEEGEVMGVIVDDEL